MESSSSKLSIPKLIRICLESPKSFPNFTAIAKYNLKASKPIA